MISLKGQRFWDMGDIVVVRYRGWKPGIVTNVSGDQVTVRIPKEIITIPARMIKLPKANDVFKINVPIFIQASDIIEEMFDDPDELDVQDAMEELFDFFEKKYQNIINLLSNMHLSVEEADSPNVTHASIYSRLSANVSGQNIHQLVIALKKEGFWPEDQEEYEEFTSAYDLSFPLLSVKVGA